MFITTGTAVKESIARRLKEQKTGKSQPLCDGEGALFQTVLPHFVWVMELSTVGEYRDLQASGEAIRQAELDRARRMLARGDDPAAVLEALSGALTRKFLHGPTHALNHTQGEDREALLRLVPGLFRQIGRAHV